MISLWCKRQIGQATARSQWTKVGGILAIVACSTGEVRAQPTKVSGVAPEAAAALQVLPMIQREISQSPEIIKAVRRQSAKAIPMSEILALDREWQSAKGITRKMRQVLTNDCSLILRQLSERSDLLGEILVMDNQGALVCSSGLTSDYYQGDEDKWRKVFPAKATSTHVSEPRFDTSIDGFALQLSTKIMDQGQAIGVITVGLALDPLMRSVESSQGAGEP